MKTSSGLDRSRAGDRVVDGLLAGMAGGIVMMGFLVLVGWMFSEPPLEMLNRFALGGGPLRGLLLHLAVSSVYGILLGLAAHLVGYLGDWFKAPPQAMLAGLIYGSFLWLISGMILLQVDVSPFATLPQPAFAIAHLIYGVTLGALLQRQSGESS